MRKVEVISSVAPFYHTYAKEHAIVSIELCSFLLTLPEQVKLTCENEQGWAFTAVFYGVWELNCISFVDFRIHLLKQCLLH